MKAQRRVDVYLYVFFNFCARWEWMVNDPSALPPTSIVQVAE